jgi:hypothetical protein
MTRINILIFSRNKENTLNLLEKWKTKLGIPTHQSFLSDADEFLSPDDSRLFIMEMKKRFSRNI